MWIGWKIKGMGRLTDILFSKRDKLISIVIITHAEVPLFKDGRQVLPFYFYFLCTNILYVNSFTSGLQNLGRF